MLLKTEQKSRDPLHGVTLEMVLTRLVELHGWEKLGRLIRIRCFNYDPSIKSSLQFLRRTPWARKKVEALYMKHKWQIGNKPPDPKFGRD